MKKEKEENQLKKLQQLRQGKDRGLQKNVSAEIFYHGTAKGNYFDKFDFSVENRGVGSNAFHQGKGIYLTDREDAARYFSKQATDIYQIWRDIITHEIRELVTEVGEVFKVQLTHDANLKTLDHRPAQHEVEQLRKQGYHAVKFPEIAFKAVEGSPEAAEILQKGMPNTIIVFDINKVNIIDNSRPKNLLQQESLLKSLPFDEALKGLHTTRNEQKIQDQANIDKERISKHRAAQENGLSKKEKSDMEELRDIRAKKSRSVEHSKSRDANARQQETSTNRNMITERSGHNADRDFGRDFDRLSKSDSYDDEDTDNSGFYTSNEDNRLSDDSTDNAE